MSLLHFFLSPHGRISRQAFWLGLIVMFGVSIPVTLLIDPTALDAVQAGGQAGQQVTSGLGPGPRLPSMLETLWSLVLTWPSAAISIKRFNDRDRPQWVGYVLTVLMALLVVANGFGMMLDPDTMAPLEKVVFAVILSFVSWSVIDNGFYKGTAGPNRYGPDPLPQPLGAPGD